LRFVAAIVSVLALVLAFFAKSTGVVGLLLVVCVVAAISSVVGFVSNKVSAGSKSQIYLPTAQERALLEKRNERLRADLEQRRAEGQRMEPDAPRPGPGPKPPTSA
jgi:hypothetical protein